MRPPLSAFGYFSSSLAPKEEKPKIPELRIYLYYGLAAYPGKGLSVATRVGTGLSGREYALQSAAPNAQRAWAPEMLRELPAHALQTADAARVIALAL